jgi:sodium-dependent dicarboxylate transporter 2/3/5
MAEEKKKATGYDKYVNWRLFIIPVILVILLLLIPTPYGMKDVGTEVEVGPKAVVNFITMELWEKKSTEADQWQIIAGQMMDRNMRMGAMTKARFLKRDMRWCEKYDIRVDRANFNQARTFVKERLSDEAYLKIMQRAAKLRYDDLKYELLSSEDRKLADKGAWHIKVAIAILVLVVFCFITECIPLPCVAFLIGIILVLTGNLSRSDVAGLYWSDSVWFIMGSLMFAAAFVKTGVDKRICLMMFKRLAVPNVKVITLIFFVVISPLAAFVSDHALAAMFLPVGMLLYQNALTDEIREDKDLAKMLMITIAMACNIGGPGAPSGGARNVIMMTYMNDMFGIDIGYFQWITYCFPFLIVMVPLTWFMINWRFKPKITSLGTSMVYLDAQVSRMGKWNRQQKIALVIFLIMVFGWFTEKEFYDLGIYPVRLGIGVICMMGAVAYLLGGVVNWRDYQEKVDWGVVWLYAGAIIFGRTLDVSGAAYWLARSIVELLAPMGMDSGIPLLATAGGLTAVITNLMADGPAAAAVGPVTLSMAALAHPGTSYVPFMGMVTAISSSFAYCLIIGTPPNAIVYASGYLEAKDFLRVGIIVWVAAIIVTLVLAGVYWNLRGFAGLPGF